MTVHLTSCFGQGGRQSVQGSISTVCYCQDAPCVCSKCAKRRLTVVCRLLQFYEEAKDESDDTISLLWVGSGNKSR